MFESARANPCLLLLPLLVFLAPSHFFVIPLVLDSPDVHSSSRRSRALLLLRDHNDDRFLHCTSGLKPIVFPAFALISFGRFSCVDLQTSNAFKSGTRVPLYTFSHVLEAKCSQEDVFKCVADKPITSFLKGENVLLAAHGATGSGLHSERILRLVHLFAVSVCYIVVCAML